MIDSPKPFMPIPTPACLPLTVEREAELRAAIVAEAMTWEGTPYLQQGDVKGPNGCVDCSMLLVRCWVDTGLVEPFDPRPYPASWHLHHGEERYLDWLSTVAVEVDEPQPGDVVAFRFGLCFSHGGIMVDRTRVIHALRGHGNCSVTDLREAFLMFERPEGSVSRPWGKRPRKFFDVFAGIRRAAGA
jgi:cell wall-associated NlpC family hydrolase